jgi:hypothetical protein
VGGVKNLCSPEIARYRFTHPVMGEVPSELRAWGGCFLIPHKEVVSTSLPSRPFMVRKVELRVIASRGGGPAELGGDDPYSRWDHVSVSLADRCPTWEEMCFIKELFFERHEPAMQLHPVKDYVNNHPYCLHLWRPRDAEIPLPFAEMVGIPGLEFAA